MSFKYILLISLAVFLCNANINSNLQNYMQQTQQCVTDLKKGLDLTLRILDSLDNQAKVGLEILMLKKLFNKNIKQSCHLSNINYGVQSSGVCLESVYQLSLVVQTMGQDIIKGNYPAAFKNFQTFLDDLPDTLDDCGQSKWAQQIRKDFPAACLRAFEDLGKQLSLFEHNFDHFEWLYTHWKDMEKVLKEVKTTCPLFA